MKTLRAACMFGWAIVASTAHAGIIHDNFENYASGNVPGGVWHDIFGRVTANPGSNPSISVITTTDAHGNTTQAVQTNRDGGTNGIYADVNQSAVHSLSADIRIDAMPSANSGWPIGLGYSKYSGQDDINANPHAVIYAWTGRVWNLFIAPKEGRPPVDLRLSGASFTVGDWYTLSLTVNSETGEFNARVYNATTGELTNSVDHTYTQWDSSIDQFNSIAIFDGDNPNAFSHGQTSIDNVRYAPAPGGLAMISAMVSIAMRRQR